MGTSLNGLTPSATYSGLIKFGDNSAIGASLKYISDGDGNDTLLAMSTASLNIGATNITARVGIKGSGSTSATTSLLVQNSAGTAAFTVKDDLSSNLGGRLNLIGDGIMIASAGGFVVKVTGGNNTIDFLNGAILTCAGENFLSAPYNSNVRLLKPVLIGGNTTQNASAQFQIDSTTTGFLPPRMTTTQKNAIATPASGLVVYDSTTNKLQCYNGSTWNDLF